MTIPCHDPVYARMSRNYLGYALRFSPRRNRKDDMNIIAAPLRSRFVLALACFGAR